MWVVGRQMIDRRVDGTSLRALQVPDKPLETEEGAESDPRCKIERIKRWGLRRRGNNFE